MVFSETACSNGGTPHRILTRRQSQFHNDWLIYNRPECLQNGLEGPLLLYDPCQSSDF